MRYNVKKSDFFAMMTNSRVEESNGRDEKKNPTETEGQLSAPIREQGQLCARMG